MKNICAIFSIYGTKTDVSSPDGEDTWGKYTLEHPTADNQAIFSFTDLQGNLELIIRHETSFMIKVWGEVHDDVIEAPSPQNYEHQNAIIEFYIRAFTVLNNFILRYRTRTFDYQNEPIKWRAVMLLDPQTGTRRRVFELGTPLRQFDVEWEVNGTLSTSP